jgi:hypothetical protein
MIIVFFSDMEQMQFKNLHKNKSQKSILPFQLSKVPLTLILGGFAPLNIRERFQRLSNLG